MHPSRPRTLLPAAARGAAAGLAGAVAMTVAEKVEQSLTSRPDSYVPGRSLRAMTGRRVAETERPLVANHAMHWGTALLLGALRGVWASVGLRGPRAHLAHTVVRLSFDQTVENASGEGAPPRTWPPQEQVWDTAHKAVYSLVTGLVAERLVAPELESSRGRTSH